MPGNQFDADLKKLRAAAQGLPHVVESQTHGTPSLKLGKKLLARLREPGVIAIPVDSEADKFLLIEAGPEIYFTIPHFDGYAYVLARMEAISDAELAHRLRLAWDRLATVTMKRA